MNLLSESVVHRKRGSRSPLASHSDEIAIDRAEHNHNSRFWNRTDRVLSRLSGTAMHRSTRTALIAIAILVCVVAVIVLLSLVDPFASGDDACLKFNREETCYNELGKPYRLYGTKTVYDVVRGKEGLRDVIKDCVPKVFYLFCRHATRYPDEEDILKMTKLLSTLQEEIHNNSVQGKVKMCKDDLQQLEHYVEALRPEYDNKMSKTGEVETIYLAERFKSQFPSLFDENYSPQKFEFEFTTRERTKSTAIAFAQGLFGDKSKEINFGDTGNDILEFHKECKVMQKSCNTSIEISEIDKFENGPLMKKVIDSVSSKIGGVPLSFAELKLLHKACAFGYALNTDDVWCSLFTKDELKVMEFADDIDDYYKDAYGNKVNYDQACPVVEHIMDLFGTFMKTSESKVNLQFSHAGSIKKLYAIFGLYKDENPLKAKNFCSQEDRKWHSSSIAPFLSNLALVLLDCGTDRKVAAFHNEKPVKLGGCSDILCSYDEFYNMYSPIAEKCDLRKICHTCGLNWNKSAV